MNKDNAVDEVEGVQDIGEGGCLDLYGWNAHFAVSLVNLVHRLLELDCLSGQVLQTF